MKNFTPVARGSWRRGPIGSAVLRLCSFAFKLLLFLLLLFLPVPFRACCSADVQFSGCAVLRFCSSQFRRFCKSQVPQSYSAN